MLSYQDWLNFQAQQVQRVGGDVQQLLPQVTTTPQQVKPGFGIAAPDWQTNPAYAQYRDKITALQQMSPQEQAAMDTARQQVSLYQQQHPETNWTTVSPGSPEYQAMVTAVAPYIQARDAMMQQRSQAANQFFATMPTEARQAYQQSQRVPGDINGVIATEPNRMTSAAATQPGAPLPAPNPVPQPVGQPLSLPNFGIGQPPQPPQFGSAPTTPAAAITAEQQAWVQQYLAQQRQQRQQQFQAQRQGGQTPSSPTGFGLPLGGWGQSPAANQQYAQFGQLGAAAGQQGGQYGYLGATDSRLPSGIAAGPWSSSPQPAARGLVAPARAPAIRGQTVAPRLPMVQRGSSFTTATPGGPGLGPTGVGTAPQTLQAYGAAMPTPNKIVARNFMKLDPDTQDFLRSGYRAQGYSDNQVNQAVQQGLPAFKLPGGSGQVRG